MIDIQNIYFTYSSGFEALKGISLKIKKGEFLAIMGQNGAGKTTLVKHFNGLLKPTKGFVLVDGVKTTELSVAQLSRKVGFVFQNPDNQLFCETVEQEISFALKNFGFEEKTIKERVDWALNILDLSDYRDISPFMLSGGERKRVAIASVLAWDPDILILDEPTIGQDNRQKERLLLFIEQLRQQDKTIVVVSHDIEFVAQSNPRVVLMSKGKVIADGSAGRILVDQDLVNKASICLPEIALIFNNIRQYGFQTETINIYEAAKIIAGRMRG